jgi:hypothetical protein
LSSPLFLPLLILYLPGGFRLRYATALEEVSRSWSGKHPSALDMALHGPLLGRKADFDMDEHIAQQIVARKLERFKKLKSDSSSK